MEAPRKFKELPYNPAIPLPGIDPKERKAVCGGDTCTPTSQHSGYGITFLVHQRWVDKEKVVTLTGLDQAKKVSGQVPLAHACNPSFSGGRDQEVGGSKSAWEDPILKKPITKKSWWSGSR
jgi:hypothetical protein